MAVKPTAITGETPQALKFSFCTLVTDTEEYQLFYQSCIANGFDGDDCEYLFIDNRETNHYDAFSGINKLLSAARGEFVILCHQDIELIDHRHILEERLEALTNIDSGWALAGNAGGVNLRTLALRISDPYGENQRQGDFPCKVNSLDENFILVRASSRIAASGDLSGFHFYGTDLCVVADFLGYSSWVIDYHVRHKSPGNVDSRPESYENSFYQCKKRFIQKYAKALRTRFIRTTCAKFILVGFPLLSRWFNTPRMLRYAARVGKYGSNSREVG